MILGLLTALAGPTVDDLDAELRLLEARQEELVTAVETRGGFDSAARELEVFQEALYAFLIEDHATAAMGFHVLLNMGTTDPVLIEDAEWYLAASFERMGFHEVAATRLAEMAGSSHPLRDDALAALVRLRAEVGPADAFRDVYQRALQSQRIRSTPELTYVLARAQYDLGDLDEARRVLAEVPADSSHGVRARYMLGVVHLRKGEVDAALDLFERLSGASATLQVEAHARDLASLAVARIHFDRKEHDAAADWYGRVAGLESVLDPSLVESIWNQVSLEDWGSTLLAFGYLEHVRPGHRDAGRMRLLEGHVLYRMGRQAEAEATYERVRELFESIVERLELLDMEAPDTIALLREPERWRPGEGLPPKWALDDLVDVEGVDAALAMRSDALWVERELEECEALVREITDALSTDGAIGRFQIYRQEVDAQLDSVLRLRVLLMQDEAERLYLAGAISRKRANELLDALEMDLGRVVSGGSIRADRYTRVGELRADRRALRAQLEVQEVTGTRVQLQAVEAELRALEAERKAPPWAPAELDRLEGRRAELRALRNDGFDGGVVDLLHTELDLQVEATASLRSRIDRDEASARIPIEATLHTEAQRIAAIGDGLDGMQGRVAGVWAERSSSAVASVTADVMDGLMQAEAGLGDVMWLRLLDTRDAIEAAQETHRRDLERLEATFDHLRTRGQYDLKPETKAPVDLTLGFSTLAPSFLPVQDTE